MASLAIVRGPGVGTNFPFEKAVLIGRTRGPDTQVVLEHSSVSRRHAMITRVDDEYMAVDLGSANGTRINGRRISRPTPLAHGDQVAVGVYLLRFTREVPATAVDTGPLQLVEDDKPGVERHVVLRLSADTHELAELEGDQAAQLASMAKRLNFLNRLGAALGEGYEESKLLVFVLDELLQLIPQADRAFVLLPDPASGVMIPHAARTRTGAAESIGVSRTLIDDVISRREVLIVLDAQVEAAYEQAQSIRMLGLKSALCAPLVHNRDVYGVLQVDTSRASSPFGRDDAALLGGIASQVALVLAMARLHARAMQREMLEHDLALAHRIQQQFLPERLPHVAGCMLAVEYEPALAVGGDFYDVIELAAGRIGIVIGDVAGKGISAALLMARLGSEVRYHSIGQTSPRDILVRVNASLGRSAGEGMFATVCMLVLDPATGCLMVANAGHPPPLVRHPDGTISPLGRVGGPPLGLAEAGDITQQELDLEVGASIVLFTDGVTEAISPGSELFGADRLSETLKGARGRAEELKDAVVRAVRDFRAAAPQSDDLTVLSLTRELAAVPV